MLSAVAWGGVTGGILQLGKGYTNPGCHVAVASNFVWWGLKRLAPQYAIAACHLYGAQDFGVAPRFLETLCAPDPRRQFPVTSSKDATVCCKTSCFQLEMTSEGKHLKYLLANNDCQQSAVCVYIPSANTVSFKDALSLSLIT